MIHKLRLVNFKCFRDQTIDMAPLTVLTGMNGMGKSSVIQSILLLKQSFVGSGAIPYLRLNSDYMSLGAAQDVHYEGAYDDTIAFELVNDVMINVPSRFVTDEWDSDRDYIPTLSVTETQWIFRLNPETGTIANIDENEYVGNKVELYSLPPFGGEFLYLNAERIGPRTSFSASENPFPSLGQIGMRGEHAAHFLAVHSNSDIPNPSLQHERGMSLSLGNQVEAWMGEISPGTRLHTTSVPEMDLVGLRFSFLNSQLSSNPYRATNVGFGLTYTLPILVGVLAAPAGALLIIENPEAHLHPRGQAMIGDLLARAAQSGVQVIIETHSDHVLNGIRLAVHGGGKPSRLDADKVRLHFFDRQEGEEGAQHIVESPKIDRDGRIDRWPEGFFDEWDKSLDALLEPRSE